MGCCGCKPAAPSTNEADNVGASVTKSSAAEPKPAVAAKPAAKPAAAAGGSKAAATAKDEDAPAADAGFSSPWLLEEDGKLKATYFKILNMYNVDGDRIACHDNRDVFRYREVVNDPHQEWLIHPVPGQDDRVRIFSKSYAGSRCMAVAADNGRVEMWEVYEEAKQYFQFADPESPDRWYNIRELTKHEVLSVDPDSKLRRWFLKPGDDGQRFRLQPINTQPFPKDIPQVEYKPGEIPRTPFLTKYDDALPDKSQSYLVAFSVVPSVLVKDNEYTNPVIQFNATPYYLFTREQYWLKSSLSGGGRGGWDRQLIAGESTTEIQMTRMFKAEAKEIQEQTGWMVQSESELAFEAVSAKASMQVTHQLGMTSKNSSELISEHKLTDVIRAPKNADLRAICWALVDSFTISRINVDGSRTPIKQWDVVSSTANRKESMTKCQHTS